MARLDELEEEDPNIRQQAAEWRQARRDAREDPDAWDAFRQHVEAIGAPDPGEEEPEDFREQDQQPHRSKHGAVSGDH